MLIAVLLTVWIISACSPKPPPITAIINCPQPTAEALSAAQPLPRVPELSTSASEAINSLSIVIAQDDDVYAGEVAKREALIKHGTERCGWTR
jgi:hypothetical protein